MEQQTKDYVRYLLGRFKEVYAEEYGAQNDVPIDQGAGDC